MFFVCDLMLELDGKRVVALLAFITREGLEYCAERWGKERKLRGEMVVACGGGKMGRVGFRGGRDGNRRRCYYGLHFAFYCGGC